MGEPSSQSGWMQNNFDFLRFALAVLVIFSHSFALLTGNDSAEPLMRLTRQVPSGAVAVEGFFIISGFLVTHSYLRSRGPLDYFRKRALRIYPGYIVALLFCALVVGPLAAKNPQIPFRGSELRELLFGLVTLRGDIQKYAFLGNPFPGSANGSLWSIPFEAWCYVGVAALGLLHLLRRRTVLALFVASVAVRFAFDRFHLRPAGSIFGVIFGWPAFWARLLPCYLAGMTVYLYWEKIVFSSKWAILAGMGLLIGALAPHGLSIALPVCGSYLLFWLAFQPRIPLQRWGKHGDFSYGIYLYAFPIQQLLIASFPGIRPLWLFACATPLAIGAGWASWHLVEKRFLKRKVRRTAAAYPAVAA